MSQRRPREKSEPHLDFIRGLPCIVCGDDTNTEAAHIRYGDPRIAKPSTGMAQKSHDRFTLPLCNRHHREQHGQKEREWWNAKGIDPVFYSLALYGCSGDNQTGSDIIRARLDMMG